MRAVIVSGGMPPREDMIKDEISKQDTILICADSGANCLYKFGIKPDILIGDFDSIDKDVLDYFKKSGCKIEKYPVAKNYTDTKIAVDKAVDLKVNEITLLGCTGNRIDHVLANIGLLHECINLGIDAAIKDSNNIITICCKDTTIKGPADSTFSLQAYCDVVCGLNIVGARYPLKDYDLHLGEGRTISNQFDNSEVKISFKSGVLLIIYSKD